MSRSTNKRRLLAAGVTALAAAAATLAPSADAAAPAPERPKVLAKKLVSPLSVEIGDNGAVYYSENFAGTLRVKRPGKDARVLFRDPKGREVGGISVDGDTVYFIRGTELMKRTPRGVRVVARLGAFEKNRNPDRKVEYGAPGLSEQCAEQWPTGPQAPPQTYTGIVESHPYATAVDGRKVYVADAAGNTILQVRPNGAVRTVAVLPRVRVEITPELAAGSGVPECAVGESYFFEPVPTDVEVGRNGKLYVSSLPGGPEDGSVPGGVFRVNPENGKARRIATGLVSATGLDVAANGDVYVSELFAGKITRIPAGGGAPRTFARAPLPAAVELAGGKVYATVNVLSDPPNGKLVVYRR